MTKLLNLCESCKNHSTSITLLGSDPGIIHTSITNECKSTIVPTKVKAHVLKGEHVYWCQSFSSPVHHSKDPRAKLCGDQMSLGILKLTEKEGEPDV